MRRFCKITIILALGAPAHCLLAAENNADLAKAVERLQKEIELLKKHSVKIAVVSDVEVAKYLEEWIDRQTELEAGRQRLKKDLDSLLDKIKNLTNSLGLLVDGDEKEKKRGQLRRLEDEYRATRTVKQRSLAEKRDRYLKRLQSKMADAVSEYADKQGYAVVILKDALLYSDNNAVDDITDKIKDIMNAEYIADKQRDLGAEPEKPDAPKQPARVGPE